MTRDTQQNKDHASCSKCSGRLDRHPDRVDSSQWALDGVVKAECQDCGNTCIVPKDRIP